MSLSAEAHYLVENGHTNHSETFVILLDARSPFYGKLHPGLLHVFAIVVMCGALAMVIKQT